MQTRHQGYHTECSELLVSLVFSYTKAWAAFLPDISVKIVLTKESMGAPHFGVSFRMAELKFKTEEKI